MDFSGQSLRVQTWATVTASLAITACDQSGRGDIESGRRSRSRDAVNPLMITGFRRCITGRRWVSATLRRRMLTGAGVRRVVRTREIANRTTHNGQSSAIKPVSPMAIRIAHGEDVRLSRIGAASAGQNRRYIRPSRIGGSSARVAAAPCSDDGGAEHEGDPGHLEAAEIVSEKHPTDDHSDGKLGAADHRGRPFAGAGSAP